MGEERGACVGDGEAEVRCIARQLVLPSDRKRGCWLVGEEKQHALLPGSSVQIQGKNGCPPGNVLNLDLK